MKDTTKFLRSRNIILKDKSDLIIGFDNGTKESLCELLEAYHAEKMKNIQEFEFDTTALSDAESLEFRMLLGSGVKIKAIG